MNFEIMSAITEIEPIIIGNRMDEFKRLQKKYGEGNWRKLKGVTTIRLQNGRMHKAEIHWYEADGSPRKEFKRKRYLD